MSDAKKLSEEELKKYCSYMRFGMSNEEAAAVQGHIAFQDAEIERLKQELAAATTQIDDFAARVRAPLLQQIADLKAGLETLGPKIICARSHYDGLTARIAYLAGVTVESERNRK